MPCLPAGDAFFDHIGWPLRGLYNKPDGGMSDRVQATIMYDRSHPCLFGADGKQWSNEERQVYTWLCAQHLYALRFSEPAPEDLPGSATVTGGGSVSWGVG